MVSQVKSNQWSTTDQRWLSHVCSLRHSQVSDEDTCHQVFRPGHPLFAASSFLLVTSQLAQPREQRRWFQTMHVIDIHECQPHLSLLVNKKRPWDGKFP